MNTNNENISQKITAVKPIYSITPFTLLDYPDKTACIIWFAGCNMRCLYCYNPDIVLGKGKLTYDDALKFLNSRKNLLDGVVLSGGECTLHKSFIYLLKEIKKLGLLVKVDTNGSNPTLLKQLINEKLINYIALDFKAPVKKFHYITKSKLYNEFTETLQYLININFPFEVRTTVHSNLINQDDLQEMVLHLENNHYTGKYFIQNFVNDIKTLGGIENSNNKSINYDSLKTNLLITLRSQ